MPLLSFEGKGDPEMGWRSMRSRREVLYPILPLPLVSMSQLEGLEEGKWYLQPKADGWHVIIGERIWTKNGKDITDWVGLSCLKKRLPFDPPVDGELIAVGVPRCLIPKLAIRPLRFFIYVFDLVMPGVPFKERLHTLYRIAPSLPGYLLPMETFQIFSWEEVQLALSCYKARGYEGVVLKRADLDYPVAKAGPFPVLTGMVKIK